MTSSKDECPPSAAVRFDRWVTRLPDWQVSVYCIGLMFVLAGLIGAVAMLVISFSPELVAWLGWTLTPFQWWLTASGVAFIPSFMIVWVGLLAYVMSRSAHY